MPNKVRVVMQLGGRWYYGKPIRAQLKDYETAWGGMPMKPVDYARWPKWKQIEWVFKHLKSVHGSRLIPMSLKIYREPRGAKDSEYVSTLKGLGLGRKLRKPAKWIKEKRDRQRAGGVLAQANNRLFGFRPPPGRAHRLVPQPPQVAPVNAVPGQWFPDVNPVEAAQGLRWAVEPAPHEPVPAWDWPVFPPDEELEP